MGVLVCLLLLLALTGHSSATYCICKDGVGDSVLQKNIDYACGAGADCTAILQNGGCFQPNTVKSHCDYAVNSYFQRKGQTTGSCDFQGTATTTASLPTTVPSTCQYQSTPGSTGTGTTTPSTGTGTGTTTPSTGTGTGTGTTPSSSITPPSSTGTGTSTGSTSPNVFGTGSTGLGPTSGTGGITDSNIAAPSFKATYMFSFSVLTFMFTGLVLTKVH